MPGQQSAAVQSNTPSRHNSSSGVKQPDGQDSVSEDGNVKQGEGFELSDILAKELHDLFLMYVDLRSNECMGVSNFIAFVCDAGIYLPGTPPVPPVFHWSPNSQEFK